MMMRDWAIWYPGSDETATARGSSLGDVVRDFLGDHRAWRNAMIELRDVDRSGVMWVCLTHTARWEYPGRSSAIVCIRLLR